MSTITMIPYEIWEIILDSFQRQDLLIFQNVCQEWYDVAIRYVMSGRLRNRAVFYHRLEKSNSSVEKLSDEFQEHQRKIWDSISVKSSKDILLTGIGIFSPVGAESIICLDAKPLAEKPIPSCMCGCSPFSPLSEVKYGEQEYNDSDHETITIYCKVPFHIKRNMWWEIIMNASRAKKYDQLNCGTLWSYRVIEMDDRLFNPRNIDFYHAGVSLDFRETPYRLYPWRTSLKDGQIPYILIWPL